MESPTLLTFEPLMSSAFSVVHDSDINVSFTLDKIVRKNEKDIQSFSLEFLGPLNPVFGQGTFKLLHEDAGEFNIFLVPVEKCDDGIIYEAVFNRMVTPPDAGSD